MLGEENIPEIKNPKSYSGKTLCTSIKLANRK